jgi:hypothetical protein
MRLPASAEPGDPRLSPDSATAGRPPLARGKMLGMFLIGVGVLAAALAAVQSEADKVAWGLYAPALALSMAGVVIARRASRQAAQRPELVARDAQTLQDSLARIITNLGDLDRRSSTIPTSEFHGLIDALLREDLRLFAEARHTITHRHGLAAYARIMNEFAAGERYVNRVWSASVDGYVDEVRDYLTRARKQFEAARQALRALETSS